MAGIILIRDGEHPWEESPLAWRKSLPADDPGLQFKRLLPSRPGAPNLQRTRYHPGHHEPPHRHPEDEILYLLAGVIHFGRQELHPGDAIFVPRDTTYSLFTRETGAEFLRVGLSDLEPRA